MAQGQSGNVAASRASFEKAIQLDGNGVFPKLNLARLDIGLKSYDEATKRLNDLLKIDTRNSEALFELSVIADRKGQQDEAQRWLEKARDAAGPKDTRWALALVDFHLRYGHRGPALDAAKNASGKAPEDLTVLLAYSRALLANGDTIGAKNTLTGATRFADYNAPRQLEIASLQMAANNPAGAAYSLEKALTGQPDYLPAQALMAEVDLRLGDATKAEKRARDIVAQNPKRAIGYTLLGNIAAAKGQPTAAIEAFRRGFEVEPATNTVLRLFQALLPQDGGKSALQLAEQWLKTNPRDVTVRKALADGYARAGNFNTAQITYEAALKANPEDAEALNNLANVRLNLKDPAGAAKTAELALTKAPGNALITDTLGWALLQAGQTDRALQLLRDARLRQPASPDIRYHLAAALAKTGRKTEARDELEAAFKLGGGFEGRIEAEKLLQTLK
jgi:putative PEP-CTERM system TPR-repeat lipoprotein